MPRVSKSAAKVKTKFAPSKEMALITAAIIKKYGKALKELAKQ